MAFSFNPDIHLSKGQAETAQFQKILRRIDRALQHDWVVQSTTDELRSFLGVDRVVLYYFYQQWEGQVTCESLSDPQYSIAGSTGPDQCFSEEYAQLYLEGRVSAIEDIETASIESCHRDFLRYIDVRANLVVPILTEPGSAITEPAVTEPATAEAEERAESVPPDSLSKNLWGLLVAHHCRSARPWSSTEITRMQESAIALSQASAIRAK